MTSLITANPSSVTGKPFSWRFTTPLFVGSALNAINSSMIATALVGLGSSCACPTAMMLIPRRAAAAGFDRPPGGVLGGLQIAGLATAAFGLPIGGVLVEAAGWRSVFFVNVPVALIVLTTALIWIPRDPAQQAPRNGHEVVSRVDSTGIIGFALAMTALLAFLFSLPEPDWIILVAAVVLFAALLLWELRAKHPFVDVRLLVHNGTLIRTYLRYALIALCVYIVLYGLSQWLEAAHGATALSAGLLLLPTSVISGLVVVPTSRRNLVRGPVIVAGLASLVGSASVLLFASDTNIVWIVLITPLVGVALGTGASGNQIALYTQAPPEKLGVASGLFRTFGYIGSIASSAITGIVFRTGVNDAGLHLIALIMIGVSVLAMALWVLDRQLHT